MSRTCKFTTTIECYRGINLWILSRRMQINGLIFLSPNSPFHNLFFFSFLDEKSANPPLRMHLGTRIRANQVVYVTKSSPYVNNTRYCIRGYDKAAKSTLIFRENRNYISLSRANTRKYNFTFSKCEGKKKKKKKKNFTLGSLETKPPYYTLLNRHRPFVRITRQEQRWLHRDRLCSVDGPENGIGIPCVRNTMALLKLASFIYLSTQVVKVISIGDLSRHARFV